MPPRSPMDRNTASTSSLAPWTRLLGLFPVVGLLVALVFRSRADSDAGKKEWSEVLLVQALIAAVLFIHSVLQLAIAGTGWLWDRSADMGLAMEQSWVPMLLDVSTTLNLVAGLGEWGFLLYFGARAATGLPLFGSVLSRGEPSDTTDEQEQH